MEWVIGAVAAAAGHQKRSCEERVRALWDRHGPFDFSRQMGETVAAFCRQPSCGEGFHRITVERIYEIVGSAERRPS